MSGKILVLGAAGRLGYAAAEALGASRLVATTGGELAEAARRDAVPVIGLPAGVEKAPTLQVKTARCGKDDVPTKAVETVVETTPHGRRLHVRVPLDVRAYGSPWPMKIASGREGPIGVVGQKR